MPSVKILLNRKHLECEGRSHIVQVCGSGSAAWVFQANLKQKRTFVRVVYHHSRMAMRSHLGGRDKREALGAVKSGTWNDPLEEKRVNPISPTCSRGSQALV